MVDVYNPMQALQAFGAGRQEATSRRVAGALAEDDLQGARRAALQGQDIQTANSLQQQIAQLDAGQRQEALQRAGVFAQAGQNLLSLPYAQRQQVIQSPMFRQQMSALGIDDTMLSQFDPTDQNILAAVAPVMELAQADEPDLPASIREYEAYLEMTPDRQQGYRQFRASGRTPPATVNVSPNFGEREDTFSAATAERSAERANQIIASGDNAARNIANVDILSDALLDERTYTGTGAEMSLPARRAISSAFNIDVGNIAGTEVARAVGNELALALKDNLPGPMSDGDRRFLQEIPPNISNSRGGNAALVFLNRRRYAFDQQLASSLEQFYAANGGPSEANFREWNRRTRRQTSENPLFSDDERRAVRLLQNGAEFIRSGNSIIVRDGEDGIVLEF